MPAPSKTFAPRRQLTWRGMLRLALRGTCWVALVVGVVLGLYLTLRPSSSFDDLWWMPKSLRHWSEYNGRLRNLPAFAVLAIPFMVLANGRRARRKAILGLAVFVAVTEAAQHFIPSRWCEWQDVACGWAGLLVTWAVFEVSFRLAWEIRQAMRPASPAGPVKDQSQFASTRVVPPAKPTHRP